MTEMLKFSIEIKLNGHVTKIMTEEDTHEHMQHLWQERHEMSQQQQDVFDYLLTHSWRETGQHFEFTSKSTLTRCITRTALGFRWHPDEHNSGLSPYLSWESEQRLVRLCNVHADGHDCLTTADVRMLAKLVRAEMYTNARAALIKRRCTILASKLVEDAIEPSSDWLTKFVERHELRLVDGQTMDRARTLSCDRSRIREYFLKWIPAFNRDPRLIFGADETDVKPTFRMKVVTNHATSPCSS